MRIRNVLITGGAGFIGSHLADDLLRHGYRVRVLDNLVAQVHGVARQRPTWLPREVELVVGDVRDHGAVERALDRMEAVFHLAAAIGGGQSMYDVERYTSVNNVGTAVLMEYLIKRPMQRLVVASSFSVYGEGLYQDEKGAIYEDAARSLAQLRMGRWEPSTPEGGVLRPIRTTESKRIALESIYALSKYDQERMCLALGRAYGIPTTALRFFNVYGTRQALSNPYTGVLAIFASRLLNENRPLLFEDGKQQRDFVNVLDAARACRLALESEDAAGLAINVGSGKPRTILEIARTMAEVVGLPRLVPEVTGRYRMGDVRHCFADISLARKALGYEPEISFERGLAELARWLESQAGRVQDRVVEAKAELDRRGLTL